MPYYSRWSGYIGGAKIVLKVIVSACCSSVWGGWGGGGDEGHSSGEAQLVWDCIDLFVYLFAWWLKFKSRLTGEESVWIEAFAFFRRLV